MEYTLSNALTNITTAVETHHVIGWLVVGALFVITGIVAYCRTEKTYNNPKR